MAKKINCSVDLKKMDKNDDLTSFSHVFLIFNDKYIDGRKCFNVVAINNPSKQYKIFSEEFNYMNGDLYSYCTISKMFINEHDEFVLNGFFSATVVDGCFKLILPIKTDTVS